MYKRRRNQGQFRKTGMLSCHSHWRCLSGSRVFNRNGRIVTSFALHVILQGYQMPWTHGHVTWAYMSSMLKILRQADHGTINWWSSPPLWGIKINSKMFQKEPHKWRILSNISLTGGGCWVTQHVNHWTQISPPAILSLVKGWWLQGSTAEL